MAQFGNSSLTELDGHEKLEQLRREAALNRLLPKTTWRHRLAATLHTLAYRLEPNPQEAGAAIKETLT